MSNRMTIDGKQYVVITRLAEAPRYLPSDDIALLWDPHPAQEIDLTLAERLTHRCQMPVVGRLWREPRKREMRRLVDLTTAR